MRFTKMQGAGNDFVVLDATDPARPLPPLTPELLRHLGDRRFGVGADQILLVEPPSAAGVAAGLDFRYRIFNGASGAEVEHCGNGARCFARYVRDRGLIHRDVIRVETVNNRLALQVQPDGRVRVDMGAPIFEHEKLPFDASGLVPEREGDFERWPLDLEVPDVGAHTLPVAVLSMGNPHAVARVDDVDAHPVHLIGPLVEAHPRFARKVNAGFVQVVSRSRIHLRVYERDAGETLACGTGACAAVVAGIRLGWLDERVDVRTRGGLLTIEWAGHTEGLGAAVFMTGPAETVFEGEITL